MRRRADNLAVAVIAHDEKKSELARLLRAHVGVLDRVGFVAPEDTARALDGIPISLEAVAPDAMGGDLQIGAAVVEGRIDAMIFLSALVAGSWEPDLRPFLRVCDIEGVPLATNLASAEILIHHLAMTGRHTAHHRARLGSPAGASLTLVRSPSPGREVDRSAGG